MAEIKLNSKITQRIDTSVNWSDSNPVLLKGEIGLESDTSLFKIGDGVSNWSSLEYAISSLTNENIDQIFK